MLFTESLNYLPAWNDAKAYSANFNAALVLPVFKRLAATISVADNYLNDPAQYYKKNSFQFIAGVTYVLP
jgi:heme-binding NEAT domain protein